MANRLADETSPYLRQHAENPVDWYPWGDEAFAEARRRDVPVLLSVGYSSCHWCHVMAHESFEHDDTAAQMNELFVNVKVDREERPDVDAIYMDYVQAATGHGGWPMTVFLTPEAEPFVGGTYFPRERRGSMLTFSELLDRVDEAWRTRRDEIEQSAAETTAHLASLTELEPADALPGTEVLDAAVRSLTAGFDPVHGGFGRAPKFPQAMSIELLLRSHHRSGDPSILHMVTTSLDAMAAGGIYDHLGGGFARYSVDERWLVPHFEKMLYDQALLTRVYLHAWQVTGDDGYRQVLDETIAYVLRDLRHDDGGLFSAEDADSEGVEGTFSTWNLDEVEHVLGDGASAAVAWWGITEAGNFEGKNILHRPERGALVRPDAIEQARAALFDVRERRVRPGLDDKVLTEWNALMLSALAEAAAATGNPDWQNAAEANGQFLLDNLRRADGRWLRSWQADAEGGSARHLAYAGDHAALVDAFVRLAELTGQARWLTEATSTADAMIELFWDDEHGGLFTTGDDAEALITRPKDLTDNATPSANSLAAVALLRLGALTGDQRWTDRAEDVLRLLGTAAARTPLAFGHLLAAVDLLRDTTEVVVTGDRPDLVNAVQQSYRPATVLAWGERTDSPLWEGREAAAGEAGKAYVCEHFACKQPVASVDELVAQLDGRR
jgi:uncharacterized protein YyaL (SSP411 family)